jgi:hypothetical protein
MLTLEETKKLLRRRAKKKYKQRVFDTLEQRGLSRLAFLNGYRLRYRTRGGVRGYALFDGEGILVYGGDYFLTPESVETYLIEKGEYPGPLPENNILISR